MPIIAGAKFKYHNGHIINHVLEIILLLYRNRGINALFMISDEKKKINVSTHPVRRATCIPLSSVSVSRSLSGSAAAAAVRRV